MGAAVEAAETLRLGGGIGYDFSTLRPAGERIASLDSKASGPVSFMGVFHAVNSTILGAGNRSAAQMGVLRVGHPDILEFVRAKQNTSALSTFNLSVAVTDAFMVAVKEDLPFQLTWGGRTFGTVSARNLWVEIMRATWDYGEPGVLFIDTINKMNNLWYCETIDATNPCGEQPLPSHGACLLGSFNLPAYLGWANNTWVFDFTQFKADIPVVVRAMDNVVDRSRYPLPEQEKEAKSKRRMGLGVMGLANAVEALGHPYGSELFKVMTASILTVLRDGCYDTSTALAKEKGPFELWDKDNYCKGEFIRTLPPEILEKMRDCGMRNSHLLSIAPTGSISLVSDNISSGIEPVYALVQRRKVRMVEGTVSAEVVDYGKARLGVEGKTADQCTLDDHLGVLLLAQKYTDSAISKTINVGDDIGWEEFQNVYMRAWEGGAKGCTTFRAAGKREGIIKDAGTPEPKSCAIDGSCAD
jgi:ribonucleoside-diphosphate reductase alpha chain